jgi:hypothetical protein
MSTALTTYGNPLKEAFSQVFGGKRKDWAANDEATNAEGQIVREFRNAKEGILLQVTGQEDCNVGKFSVKRLDTRPGPLPDAFNVSIPKSWIA